ncbi:transposase IS200/IS605 family (plasmid) [Butyrivibrio proteoclasticus B316]|uniref:Transposase IS200/IS605 family n=1 Tax=Butyrivibrio proteoclasticus (strain ATCC 51982 / DSM 14932 / B316) TaxID=515622 RepID=E0S3X0_BUTPB|nr:RNA-guided endonuclease TnpB family protein [Butyrivibrio proteoclasticus]ADL36102.1 transposase IS200/IS605 family [Butyrivibrio proteoclasticus B316]
MEQFIYLRYQYRIYPNITQRKQMSVTADCCRFVHNYYLNMRSLAWRTQHRSMNYNACANDLKYLKLVYPWLKEADSMALQEELKDLQLSFEKFFSHSGGYPKFRSKKESGISYRTRNQNGGIRLSLDKHFINIPKIGMVRIKLSRDIPGEILNATLIRKPSGKYFVSLTLKIESASLIKGNHGMEHGLDLGLRSFYVLDDGTVAPNMKYLYETNGKLIRAQRRLSRMKKGSSNYIKQKRKVARLHEKVCFARHDYLHKESTRLAKMCSLLCIEDLNIKGMIRNHKLARSISDASWSEFTKMLEYKMPLYQGALVKVPRFYASSQTCHICGHRNPKTKDLAIRRWTCTVCGTEHDRDVNAARCLLQKGRTMLPDAA